MTARPPRSLAAALALALALGGCAFSSENNPLSSGELSIEKEKEITADVASQIREHLPLVVLKVGPHRFGQSDCLRGDDVHQRAALSARKHQ